MAADNPPLPLLSGKCVADWEGAAIPEREWLVGDWIPRYTTTALYGDGGLGKSLLAMQLMTCCAGGKRFLNRDTMTGTAVGLFCEDSYADLLMRQSRINTHYDVSFKELSDLHYFSRTAEPDNAFVKINNRSPEETLFFKSFRETCLHLEAKLVVVDTAADTFWGSEIDRMHVRFYVQLLNRLANEICGTVVLLAHPSLSGMTSGTGTGGSTAWNNSVRSRFYLTKPRQEEGGEENTNLRHLTHMKANYGAIDAIPTVLQWEQGVYKLKLEEGGIIRKLELSKLRDECHEVMERYHRQNVNLSIYPNVKNYAPRMIKEKLKGKHPLKDIKIVFEQMLDDGVIENVSYGPPSRNLSRIVLPPPLLRPTSPYRSVSEESEI